MENLEKQEGKKTDNLEATSASEPTKVEEKVEQVQEEEVTPTPELATSPVPTSEEIKESGIATSESEPVMPESDQPVVSENVDSEPVSPEVAPNPTEPVVEESSVTESVETEAVAPVEEPVQVHEENGVTEMPALKTFTQNQVNDMVGTTRTETREKTFRYIYDRYGVNSEAELDELVGNAQRYDSLNEKYEGDKKAWKTSDAESQQKLADLSEQVALMQSGIDSGRYEDAKFILKGKGLDVSLDNIKSELATHPEWSKKGSEESNPNFVKSGEPAIEPQPAEPESKISVLGNDNAPSKGGNEEDYVLGRMFKV